MIGDWIDQVDYLQLPAMNEKELVSFFDTVTIARLATHNEDGGIHMTPIFFKYGQGKIIMATQAPSRKVRNIQCDHRVTDFIDKIEVPFK